jgi:hypothetical protein
LIAAALTSSKVCGGFRPWQRKKAKAKPKLKAAKIGSMGTSSGV